MSERSRSWDADFRLLAQLVPFLWSAAGERLRLRLLAAVSLILVTAILNTITPILFKHLIDGFVGAALPVSTIPVALIGAYLASQWLARACTEFRWLIYGRFKERLERLLMLRLFDHIHGLSLRFHLMRRTGGLQQMVGHGLLGYGLVLHNLVFVFVPLILELLMVGGVLIGAYNGLFLIILLVTASLYGISSVIGIEQQQVAQRTATNANIDAFAQLTDSYLNYETIQYFAVKQEVRQRLDRSLLRAEQAWSQFYGFRTAAGQAQALCVTVGVVATVLLAANNIAASTMTVGDFVLVTTYMLQLIRPLESLGTGYGEIRTGLTYVHRLLEVLDQRAEVTDPEGAKPLPAGPGEVMFSGVCFGYERRRPVLHDVTFRIPPGASVAIVGPSGAGKSTLCRLLFRFYDVSGGCIRFDGHCLRDLTIESLRSAIAIVPQDIILFNDSLAYNIGIGRSGSERSEIEEAARIAEIHDFILSLPEGYDTIVGERGLKLSGGEKQRVAIARAVLKRPRILVLDEATSALDSEIERRVQRNLKNLFGNSTKLVVAHRLSTVADADEILVLSQGRIVQRGRHDSLIKQNGVYRALWQHQQQWAVSSNADTLHAAE